MKQSAKNKILHITLNYLLTCIFLGILFSSSPVSAKTPKQKPRNILILYSDDQSYNTLRILDNKEITIPSPKYYEN